LPPLSLEETFFPLGFPVRVSTNSEAILECARREWSAWVPAFDAPSVNLRFEVAEAPGALPPPTHFGGYRHLFGLTADAENFAIGDTRAGLGAAWLTPRAVNDIEYFHYHFLDAMAHVVLESLYLTPIHATCVAREGRGVLLCGDSGAGKSTMAYACARQGWNYISDDASYLVRRRATERLIIGNAHRFRLRPDAALLFPELSSYAPAMRGNGKMSLELWTRDLASIAASPATQVDQIVFLERKPERKPRWKPLSNPDARAWCERVFFHWDPEVKAEQSATLSALLDTCELRTLEYSNFQDAVNFLEG
jgi:hypothetical protein